jgi:hypothetical protein
MKKSVLFMAVFLFAATMQAGSWTGWITDDHCGSKGTSAGHKDCALKCLGKGGTAVFYNNADKKIYKIDNQDMAKANLGHEVVVTGSVDGDSIKVESIKEAPKAN